MSCNHTILENIVSPWNINSVNVGLPESTANKIRIIRAVSNWHGKWYKIYCLFNKNVMLLVCITRYSWIFSMFNLLVMEVYSCVNYCLPMSLMRKFYLFWIILQYEFFWEEDFCQKKKKANCSFGTWISSKGGSVIVQSTKIYEGARYWQHLVIDKALQTYWYDQWIRI